MMFRENDSNYKIGIKELEKIINNYFDEAGFPKSRNPEEVFICIKYLILIREWFKEAQKPIPDFLNEIIHKCGNCYAMLILLPINNSLYLMEQRKSITNIMIHIFKNFKI